MQVHQIKRILVAAAALLFATAALSGSGTTTDRPADDSHPATGPLVTIRISGLAFVPATITVVPGTRVRWLNVDPIDHDVTSGRSITGRKSRGLMQTKFPDGRFSSGLFGLQKTFEHTFQEPGDYPYYCSVHPFMTATISVKQPDD